MRASDVEGSEHQYSAYAAKNRPTILVQRVGGFAGRPESPAGTSVSRSGSRGSWPSRAGILGLILQRSFSGNFKSQLLAGPRIACNFRDCVGLIGRLLVLIHAGLCRGKSDGARQDGDEVLQRIDQARINRGFSGIRHVNADLKLGLSGTQGKDE